jgi:preprotein translocase subunit SecD
VELGPPQAFGAAQTVASELGSFELREPDQAAGRFVLAMLPKEVTTLRELSVRQALETIRNRVDQFGVAEPAIQQQGENRIIVQLPGVQDPERAKSLIGKTALLEFARGRAALTRIGLRARRVRGLELVYQRRIDKETRQERRVPFVVQRKACHGAVLERACPSTRTPAALRVRRVCPAGARVFAEVTGQRRPAARHPRRQRTPPLSSRAHPGWAGSDHRRLHHRRGHRLAIVLRGRPTPVQVLEERRWGRPRR